VATRAGLRPASHVPTLSLSRAWPRVLAFGLIASVAYLGGGLAGQVMLEQARREGLWARERAREARRAEAFLRKRVDDLSSFTAIHRWAASHGFVAPEGARGSFQGGVRVAKLDP
jgi:hypothetical protein